MFNKSKKYGIVKCLPFICFANINAVTPFRSAEDQIKFIVNGKEYVLWDGVLILNDNTQPITLENLLKRSITNINYDLEQALSLPFKTEDINSGMFKLISYRIGDNNIVSGDDVLDKFNKVTGIDVGSNDLIITFEQVYKLSAHSELSDGKNIIDLTGKEILNSDLRPITNLNELFNFINTKFAKDTFSKNGDSCLSGKKGAEIDKNKFFISGFNYSDISDGNYYDKLIKSVIEQIELLKLLDLQFSPYINYKIEDIKLSEELAKTRKLEKGDSYKGIINALNNRFGKSLKQINLKDINNFISSNNVTFGGMKIVENDTLLTDKEINNIVVTEDNANKVSKVMKGTIYFTYDHNKLKQLKKGVADNKFENEINFDFGTPNNDFDNELSIAKETTEESIKASIKKYLGDIEIGDKYDVDFSKGFTNNKVTDEFVITVNIKDEIPHFTAKLDETEINVQVEFKIDNDDSNYELSGISNNDFTLKNVNVYDDFVAALKKELKDIDNEIKEVKFETTNKVWSSDAEKSNVLQTFLTNPDNKVIGVTVTLKRNDNGTYVKKKTIKPADNEQITFKLNLSTLVKGYKIKDNKTEITVTVPKTGLNYSTLFNAIQTQIGDNKFKIMKGGSSINNSEAIDITNPNEYSINLEEGSSLLDKNKKEDDEETRNTEDKEGTEQQKGKSNKRCCNCKEGCNCKKN